MATALDVCTRAARKRLRESGLALTSDESVYVLDELNDMLAAWALDGLDIAHLTLELADTVEVPDDHLQAIILNLAVRLTDFGGSLDPFDIAQAGTARDALVAYHFAIGDLPTAGPKTGRTL